MRYPKECPVFEVTQADGCLAAKGAIGIGVSIGRDHRGDEMAFAPDEGAYFHASHAIGLQLIAGPEAPLVSVHPTEGWRGAMVHCRYLRPLTPAAVAMLECLS